MSDPYERSYYEIALTNGQVLVALGMLLGCLFGAFLSGMWVAKKAMDRRPAPVHVAVADEGTESSPGYEFFGGGAGGPAAALPSPGTPAPQAVRPLAEDRTPPVTDRPAATEAAPEVTPAPPPTEETETRVATAAPSSGAPTASGASAAGPADLEQVAVIQVFSSNDQQQASQLLGRLRGAGYRAFLSPVTVDGRTMYRVRVGPFDNRGDAQGEAEKIKRIFKLDTWITTN